MEDSYRRLGKISEQVAAAFDEEHLELESEEGSEEGDGAMDGGAWEEEDGEEPVDEDEGSGEGEEGDSEEGGGSDFGDMDM